MPRPPPEPSGFFSQLPSRGRPCDRSAPPGRGCPVLAQDVGDPNGITDRAEGLGVDAPEPCRREICVHPFRVVFQSAGIKPGRRSKCDSASSGELPSGLAGDRCDRRDRPRRGRDRRNNRRSEDESRTGAPKTRRRGCSRPGSAGHEASELQEKCLDKPRLPVEASRNQRASARL